MTDKITKEMSLSDVVQNFPETVEIFQKHGLHCMGCAMASFETLEQGAAAHGMDLKNLLEDLNKAVEKKK